MRHLRWSIAAILITLMVTGPGARAADDGGGFKSPAAVVARNAHARKVEVAEREYREKVAAAHAEYAAALEQAQGVVTKAGNLDEAVRIRDAAARVKAEAVAARPAAVEGAGRGRLTAAVLGTTWQSPTFTFELAAENRFTASGANGGGRWFAVDDRRVILVFDNGWVNLLTFDDGLAGCEAVEARMGGGWKGKRAK
jgi:hypothetical protein